MLNKKSFTIFFIVFTTIFTFIKCTSDDSLTKKETQQGLENLEEKIQFTISIETEGKLHSYKLPDKYNNFDPVSAVSDGYGNVYVCGNMENKIGLFKLLVKGGYENGVLVTFEDSQGSLDSAKKCLINKKGQIFIIGTSTNSNKTDLILLEYGNVKLDRVFHLKQDYSSYWIKPFDFKFDEFENLIVMLKVVLGSTRSVGIMKICCTDEFELASKTYIYNEPGKENIEVKEGWFDVRNNEIVFLIQKDNKYSLVSVHEYVDDKVRVLQQSSVINITDDSKKTFAFFNLSISIKPENHFILGGMGLYKNRNEKLGYVYGIDNSTNPINHYETSYLLNNQDVNINAATRYNQYLYLTGSESKTGEKNAAILLKYDIGGKTFEKPNLYRNDQGDCFGTSITILKNNIFISGNITNNQSEKFLLLRRKIDYDMLTQYQLNDKLTMLNIVSVDNSGETFFALVNAKQKFLYKLK